ncbi:MAG TPA: hypothetical protein PKW79_00645 [Rhabdochlamydiaceae bacterium]|nr:hypothetical protein [Rhabdochlamydiaceae bacterium]
MIAKDDPSCLESLLVVPGETKTIEIKNPQNKAIGVYCIFTHPGEEWKYIAQNSGNAKIKMLIVDNEIRNVNAF